MSAPDTLDLPKTTARPGPFDWYRNINQQERRTFWSCKIGYGLDGMDTQMLSFVIPTLILIALQWGRDRRQPNGDTPVAPAEKA